MKDRHVLSVLVENRFGELARVVGLFAGRGFNIDSLAVNVTTDPAFSKIVLVTRGSDSIVEQIVKQLRKLIRVKKVVEMSGDRFLERELCVATVQAGGPTARQELERVVSLTGARVIAFSQTAFTVEAISFWNCSGRSAFATWCARHPSRSRGHPPKPKPNPPRLLEE
jgi:acetolactate synthase-1/3 small subunit